MKIYEYKGRRYQFNEADVPEGAVEVKPIAPKTDEAKAVEETVESKAIEEPKNKAIKPVNKGKKASTK